MRLVTLDLDGTLVSGTVFEAIARHFGFGDQVRAWDEEYFAGKRSLEEVFRLEFEKIAGSPLGEVHRALGKAPWTPGIAEAVAMLRDAELEVAVLTDQPRFCCEYLSKFGLTQYFCSEAAVEDGKVTGRVEPRFDKLANLRTHLEGRVPLAEVCHVGNGPNDVPVFDAVGHAVAVNPLSDAVADAADAALWGMKDLQAAAEQVLELRG